MKTITCDFETQDLAARYDKDCAIRCVGFYNNSYRKVLSAREAEEKLHELAGTHRFIFHNASFDMAVIRTHYGIELFNKLKYHDTQLLAYCLDASQKVSLQELAKKYFNKSKVSIDDFRTVDIKRLALRCLKDCELTYNLFKALRSEIEADEDAYNHYAKIELPYVKLIIEMELNGLGISEQELRRLYASLTRLTEYTSRKLHKHHSVNSTTHWRGNKRWSGMLDNGEWFETTYSNLSGTQVWEHTKLELWNHNSSTQNALVLKKLYPRAGFDFRETKDGKITVDSKELSDWAKYYKYPVLTLLAAKSKQAKLLDFCSNLNEHNKNGRIYASMNQCVTRTGRLSSSNPNLQNIPARDAKGKRFRKLFVPAEGQLLVVGDLDRIELVVLAHYLEEYGYSTYMADAIRAGDDLHQLNADNWKCKRDQAKKVIFTLIYGAGDLKLASTLGCDIREVRAIKQNIFDATGLEDFREQVIRQCKRNDGVLHDIMGRRLCVPEIMSSNPEKRAAGERRINNYLIQGSAGSIFKYLQLKAKRTVPNVDLLNVVHDEAIYSASVDYAEEASTLLTQAYSNDSILSVPVRASFKAGQNWYAAKT